jgi:hypothetical protein
MDKCAAASCQQVPSRTRTLIGRSHYLRAYVGFAMIVLLEPLLIIAMGGIVLAILLPIFDLNQIVR